MLVSLPMLGPLEVALLCAHYIGLGLFVWFAFLVVRMVGRLRAPASVAPAGANGLERTAALDPGADPLNVVTMLMVVLLWPVIIVSCVLFILVVMVGREGGLFSGDRLLVRFVVAVVLLLVYMATVWPWSWQALRPVTG